MAAKKKRERPPKWRRQGSRALSKLILCIDEELENFREELAADTEVELERLRQAQAVLEIVGRAVVEGGAQRWSDLSVAWDALAGAGLVSNKSANGGPEPQRHKQARARNASKGVGAPLKEVSSDAGTGSHSGYQGPKLADPAPTGPPAKPVQPALAAVPATGVVDDTVDMSEQAAEAVRQAAKVPFAGKAKPPKPMTLVQPRDTGTKALSAVPINLRKNGPLPFATSPTEEPPLDGTGTDGHSSAMDKTLSLEDEEADELRPGVDPEKKG